MSKKEQIQNQKEAFFYNKYGEKYDEWNNLQSKLAGYIKVGAGKYLETTENREAIKKLLQDKILEINARLNRAHPEIEKLQLEIYEKEQELSMKKSGVSMYTGQTQSENSEIDEESIKKIITEKQKLEEKLQKLINEERGLYEVAIDADIEICKDKLNRIQTPLGEEAQKKADERVDAIQKSIDELCKKANEDQQKKIKDIEDTTQKSKAYVTFFTFVFNGIKTNNKSMGDVQVCNKAYTKTEEQFKRVCQELEDNIKKLKDKKENYKNTKNIVQDEDEKKRQIEIQNSTLEKMDVDIKLAEASLESEKAGYDLALATIKKSLAARHQLQVETIQECQKQLVDEMGDDLFAQKAEGMTQFNLQSKMMYEMSKWPQSIIDMFNQISELLYFLMTGIKPKLPGLKQPNFNPEDIKIKLKDLMLPVFDTLKTLPVPEIPLISPLLQILDVDPVNKDLSQEKLELLKKIKQEVQIPNPWKDSLMFFMQTISTCMALFPMLLIKLIFDILDAIIGMFNEIAGIVGVPQVPYPLNLVPKVIKMIPDLWDMMCNLPGSCWLIIQDKFKDLAANLTYNSMGTADVTSNLKTPKQKDTKIECPKYMKEKLKQKLLEQAILEQSGLTSEENKRLNELKGLISKAKTDIDKKIKETETAQTKAKGKLISEIEELQKEVCKLQKEYDTIDKKRMKGINTKQREQIQEAQEKIDEAKATSFTSMLKDVGKSIASFDSASSWSIEDLEIEKSKEILKRLEDEASGVQVVKTDSINTNKEDIDLRNAVLKKLGITS